MRVQTIKAALKVFTISQIGDLFFLCASSSVYAYVGSASFDAVFVIGVEVEHLVLIKTSSMTVSSF